MPNTKRQPPVRRLWPSDISTFKAHLARLDREALYDRFGGYPSEAFLNDYVRKCICEGAVIYGYFEDGILRAAGELRPSLRSNDAEAAFSVETAWRKKGIGAALFAHILRTAHNRHLESVSVLCLPHNNAMLNLARKFEAEIHFESDEITGRLIARKLSPLSLWSEYLEDSFGFVEALIDVQKRFFASWRKPPVETLDRRPT